MSNNKDYKKADLLWDVKYFFSTYFFGYPLEIWGMLKHFFVKKQSPQKKFAIFSTGRSGSTLLVSLLNSNGNVHCDGEILKHRYLAPFKMLNRFANQSTKPIYGFKLLTHHIKDVQLSGKRNGVQFMQDLIREGYQIIYLERKHRLNQSLSMMYAIFRNDWHKKEEKKSQNGKLNVDLGALDWWMNGFDELNAYEKELLQHLPHVHLVYEEDLADHRKHKETMARVCDFLQIEPIQAKTKLRKITPKNYNSFISNTKALIAHLTGTKYEHYLKEQLAYVEDLSKV